jgi:putative dimethyl sulfoxide reductase chaperone
MTKALVTPTAGQQQAYVRSQMYRCLGLVFCYPDALHYEEICDRSCGKHMAAALAETDMPELAGCRKHIDVALRALEASTADHLCEEHIGLFGHTAQGHIPLYETEYGNAQSLRGLHDLGDIAGFYRAFGLSASQKSKERIDHVSIECAFMHVLCYKEAYAIAEGQEEHRAQCVQTEQDFLKHHVGWWVPSMLRRIIDQAGRDSLYGAWASCGAEFLRAEQVRFGLPAVSEHLGLRTPNDSFESACVSCAPETACPGGSNAMEV